jgi:pyruvate kinase
MDRPKTKLVCTIGPASAERIGELVAAGMDVARINFSHGTPEDHKEYVHAVRAAAHSARRSVAVMADLPGPKIRLGEIEGGEVTLETGSTFTLRPAPAEEPKSADEPKAVEEPKAVDASDAPAAAEATGSEAEAENGTEAADAPPPADGAVDAATEGTDTVETQSTAEAPDVAERTDTTGHAAVQPAEATRRAEPAGATATPGNARGASVSTAGLSAQLEIGDRILLADGAAELRVTGMDGTDVVTEVVHGGPIRSRGGVNIPSTRLTGDGLTDADRAAVPRALELRVDLIAQSFVRSADDVRALRALLPPDGPRLLAKIETHAAVEAIDPILTVADGIMVARGDLGVDVAFEEVPLIQKELVDAAASADRFSIVATQMLESMTSAPRPTRAEASDVANAVLDGTDAVMLSAETAIGAFPIEALQAMSRICLATERAGGVDVHPPHFTTPVTLATATILAATQATKWTDVGALWCFTRSGHTAEKLSMTRPDVPIVAFTLSPIVARRLAIRRGVIPMILPTTGKGEPLIARMEAAWRAQRNHAEYDTVILVTTSGSPTGINRFEIHRLSGQQTGAT